MVSFLTTFNCNVYRYVLFNTANTQANGILEDTGACRTTYN
ncbi:hypothetical protein [Zobellia nedashkovskayae]|nr:hypothetical protein [Zobellia nedashkovskayae]